jgi:hypothetical protein
MLATTGLLRPPIPTAGLVVVVAMLLLPKTGVPLSALVEITVSLRLLVAAAAAGVDMAVDMEATAIVEEEDVTSAVKVSKFRSYSRTDQF